MKKVIEKLEDGKFFIVQIKNKLFITDQKGTVLQLSSKLKNNAMESHLKKVLNGKRQQLKALYNDNECEIEKKMAQLRQKQAHVPKSNQWFKELFA